MRINKLITLISVMFSVYIIMSCATTHPREKMLVGTWKPHKAAPYFPNTHGAPAITGMKVADTTNTGKQKEEKESNSAFLDEKQAVQIQHVIETQMRTTMKINANKTCEIQFPGKLINATWKLKKNGTNLIVKDAESGQKRTLEFVFINDTTSMAIQHTNAGDIIVRYRKQ